MPIIQTSEITQSTRLAPNTGLQVYCGLDCGVTIEVREELGRLFNETPEIYNFERALQGPYLEIMLRGFRVDQIARSRAASELRSRIERLERTLNQMATAVWHQPLNPRSPKQLTQFFYRAMGLPEVWLSQKGERKLSTNREALEKLEVYLHARPIIACILSIRDLAKQLQVFDTDIDADGRFRTSYNIAGTETGRPSSSENAFGTGGNAQNIAPGLRYVFVADPGWKLVVIDLEQVEARDVGFFCGCLFNNWEFLDACESGDLHTNNARRIWPELNWTGDNKKDRAIADRNFYREFSYRDMAKRGSHLSNYYGTAWTASRHLKVPIAMMEEFQARYIRGRLARPGQAAIEPAYPAIAEYWQWVATELQTTHQLTTPFGRRRHFFGRPGDDTTLREAIAFLPQSTTADRMNLGLWRVWKHMPHAQLLAQTYDSVTFQVREGPGFDDAVAEALQLIADIPLYGPNGRRYAVPGEAKVGYNWGNMHDPRKAIGPGNRFNPDGLVKWSPGADRRARANGLQRIMEG
jgi:DNA polymerase I-like protein with 3'-5' exonuclease and polymerase domains